MFVPVRVMTSPVAARGGCGGVWYSASIVASSSSCEGWGASP